MSLKEIENKIMSSLASVKGDAMLLLVVIFLFLFSINTVLASSSLLMNTATERISTFYTQLGTIAFSCGIMAIIYKFGTFKRLIIFGNFFFFVSLILLVILRCDIDVPGVFESQKINGSMRTIKFFGGIQLHVFEMVKIFSIMYMAWAAVTLKEDELVYIENENDYDILNDPRGFRGMRRMAFNFQKAWIDHPLTKRILFVYLPFVLTTGMVAMSSNSSGIIVAAGMTIALFIGGFDKKKFGKFFLLCCTVCVVGLASMVLMKGSNGSGGTSNRIDTAKSRFELFFRPYEKKVVELRDQKKAGKISESEYNKFIDENRQTQGAKIAIREGRITPLGKFPGGSTQKYKVTNIYGDFMFSFICEEYGILGAIFVLFLFGCLIARGIRIANYCSSNYARTIVAGMVILISGQALLHILVNVGIIPMTGQTLPILSDGKSAFVMFSIGLAVVLCISRLVHEDILKVEYEPTVQREGDDEVQNTLDDLDALDTNGLE